jgi:high-affinity iron transporter
MSASLLITLREGLEAARIVGIVLGVLRKVGHTHRRVAVWAGVGAALGTSVLVGLSLHLLGVGLEGRSEKLFEGLTMLLAAGVLTWMIFWMHRQGRHVQTGIEADVQKAIGRSSPAALFLLYFVAVVREGIETVLFLTAASFEASAAQTWVGALIGLALAAVLGWLIFASSQRLDLRLFFRATGILLLLFAAGLFARGIHELQEGGVFPIVVEHVWDINATLNESEGFGSFLKTLFGYNGNPSLLEVIGYGVYVGVIGLTNWLQGRPELTAPAVKARHV